jgi:hypothetical protein
MQEYVTVVDASGNANQLGSGFLPSIVCPGPMNTDQTHANFSEPLKYVSVVIDRFCSYSDSLTRILQVQVP